MSELPSAARPVTKPKRTGSSWRPSRIRLLLRSLTVVCPVALVATKLFAGPNVLVNGDFESYSQSSMANNIPGIVTPWVVGGGQQPNVVKVLADGSYHYKAGPWRDASNATGNGPRHYLDITQGHNDIYQSFTPPCNGEVEFGGSFSSRCDDNGTSHAGTGSVRIVQGTGTSGTTVGTTVVVNLPAGHNAHTDPWVPTPPATATVVAGQPYSFVVTMDNDVNFDEAFVRYKIECNASPTPTPTQDVSPTPTPTATPGASPTATPNGGGLPCADISTKDFHCQPDGSYSYTATVANNYGSGAVTQILLTPVGGGAFTVSPQLFNLASPLQTAQSTTITTTIRNAKPGDKVCFLVSLMADNAPCCTLQVCPALPPCGNNVSPTPQLKR
jgi:hypothetical protein